LAGEIMDGAASLGELLNQARPVLEFGSSLREARDEAIQWAQARAVAPLL
jgi:hypothetical protein